MQLNQLMGPNGSSSPPSGTSEAELRHSRQARSHAAGVAHDLFVSTGSAKGKLTSAHEGLAAGTKGLASARALKEVFTSWETRCANVRDECRSPDPALRQVARDLHQVDHGVGTKTEAVRPTPGTRHEG